MNLPEADWTSKFTPLSPLEAAQNQQAMSSLRQNGQLEIDTRRQELETENKLAPFKIQEAEQDSQTKKLDYENDMLAATAQRARAADPKDAPQVWDDGMQALADKGIGVARQYVGHYRPDLADHVYDTFNPAEGKGARGGRGGVVDGSGAKVPDFDVETFTRSVAGVPLPKLQQSLTTMNKVIDGFNRINDQASWDAELRILNEAGMPVEQALGSTEYSALNYAKAARLVQGMAARRDVVADRVGQMAVGLPGETPKPMYEPDYGYIGPEKGTDKAVILDRHTGQIGYGPAVGPKPSAQIGVFQAKRDAWLAVHPGDDAGAIEFANGKRRMDPSSMQIAAINAANRALSDATLAGDVIENPDRWVRDKVSEYMGMISGAGAAPGGAQPGGRGAQGASRPARMSQADVQASIAGAKAALKRHPDKRAVILSRLKAAGVPTQGL